MKNEHTQQGRRRNKLALSKPVNKPWSHQQELQRLIGKSISIYHGQGARSVGTLLNADQFALQIQQPDSKSALTLFKHAISGFAETEVAE